MLISFSVKTTAVAQGKEQNQKMTEVVTKRDSVMTVTGFRSLRATQLFLSVKTESACECRGGGYLHPADSKGRGEWGLRGFGHPAMHCDGLRLTFPGLH